MRIPVRRHNKVRDVGADRLSDPSYDPRSGNDRTVTSKATPTNDITASGNHRTQSKASEDPNENIREILKLRLTPT